MSSMLPAKMNSTDNGHQAPSSPSLLQASAQQCAQAVSQRQKEAQDGHARERQEIVPTVSSQAQRAALPLLPVQPLHGSNVHVPQNAPVNCSLDALRQVAGGGVQLERTYQERQHAPGKQPVPNVPSPAPRESLGLLLHHAYHRQGPCVKFVTPGSPAYRAGKLMMHQHASGKKIQRTY